MPFPVHNRTILTAVAEALIVTAMHLSAQEAVTDSARTYAQPAVVVQGSRLVQRSATTLGAITRVEGWSLRRLDGRTIDAVLGDETGLFIRDLGGSSGVKTASVRGASANQTVVLFNGMRLNSPQNGLVDLGLYPVELFDAVDVVRGGQSALYGPDAMAGMVLLSSGSHGFEGIRVGMHLGSFGERGASIFWNARTENTESSLRTGIERSDGAYPFPWTDGTGTHTRTREGSSTRRMFASASVLTRISPVGVVEATILGVRAVRGSPGPVTSAASSASQLRDDLAHVIVRAVLSRGTKESWEAGVSGSLQDEEFEEEATPPIPADRYRNGVLSGWLQWQSVLDRTLTVGIGLEATASRLDGRAFPGGTDRQGGAVLTSLRWRSGEGGLTVLPMVRWDVFSDIGPQASPRVALEWPVREDGSVILRASAGSGFRVPNFNELYWLPGGNPTLRPERAVTVDGGIDVRASWLGKQHFTAGVFYADTRDRITGWPPSNVARTSTRGLEGTWTWSLSVHRLWATGTFASVESREPLLRGRQAPYVPRLVGSGGVDVMLGSLTLSPGFRYVSRRYTTSDNVAALSVAPSARAALHLKTTVALWGMEVDLQGGVENMFNVAEESLPGYPLPGRSYTVRSSLHVAP